MRYKQFDDFIIDPETGNNIREGTPQWDDLQQWLAAGNKPESADQSTSNALTLSKIAEIEASVTDRRIREAVLGIDGGWLKALNDQVAALRAQIK